MHQCRPSSPAFPSNHEQKLHILPCVGTSSPTRRAPSSVAPLCLKGNFCSRGPRPLLPQRCASPLAQQLNASRTHPGTWHRAPQSLAALTSSTNPTSEATSVHKPRLSSSWHSMFFTKTRFVFPKLFFYPSQNQHRNTQQKKSQNSLIYFFWKDKTHLEFCEAVCPISTC